MASSSEEAARFSARSRIQTAIEVALKKAGIGDETVGIQLERPNNPENGDISCNVALIAAKKLKRNPRELAEMIRDSLELDKDFIGSVEVAGPGFLNFSFSVSHDTTGEVAERNATYSQLLFHDCPFLLAIPHNLFVPRIDFDFLSNSVSINTLWNSLCVSLDVPMHHSK